MPDFAKVCVVLLTALLLSGAVDAVAQSSSEKLARAKRLEQGGVLMEAKALLEEIVLEDSENIEARIELAGLLLKLGQMEAALPHIDWLAQRAPGDSRVASMVNRARDYRREKYGRDLNRYEVQLEETNNAPEVVLEYARWLAGKDEMDQAYQRYQQYLAQRPGDTNVRFELAQQYAWHRQYGNARAELARMLRSNPNSPRAHLLLGDMHYWQGKNVEALKEYRQVLQISPDNAVARRKIAEIENQPGYRETVLKRQLQDDPTGPPLNELAELYIEQDRIWEADSLLNVRLQAVPDDERAQQLATTIEVRKRDMQMKEIEELRLRRMENPADTTALLGLARYYTSVPDFDAALDMYDEYLDFYPEDYDVRLERAKVLSWAGYTDEAASEFEQISITLPDNREARLGHAEALLAAGVDLQHAGDIFANDLEEYPESQRSKLGLADVHRNQGYYKQARTLYKEVLEHDPENQRATRGLQALETDMNPLINRLERQVAADPTDFEAIRHVSLLLFGSKRYFEAEDYVDMYLEEHPNDDRFRKIAEEIDILKENQLTAERIKLKRYVTEHPDDTDARIRYAGLLAAEKDVEGAIAQYRLVMQRRPDDEKLKYNVAMLLANKGQYDAAIPLLDELADHDLDNFDYRFQLGKVHAWAGHYDQALEEYHRALEMQPANEELRIAIGNAHRWSGDMYRAHDEYRRVLAINPANAEAEKQLDEINETSFLGLQGTGTSSWDSEDFSMQEGYSTAILAVSLKMQLRGGVGGIYLSQSLRRNPIHDYREQGNFYLANLEYRFDRQTRALLAGRYYVFEYQQPWYLNFELQHTFTEAEGLEGFQGSVYYRSQPAVFEIASVEALATFYDELTTDRFGLRGSYSDQKRWYGEADLSYTSISDGNNRSDAMAEIRYAIRHFLQLGANYQYITSEQDNPDYWTPDGYATFAGVVQLHNSFTRWSYKVRGTLGRVMETGDATRSISANVGFRFGQHFNVSLGGFALRTVRVDGGYSYSALLGSLVWSL